jgi:hypothetical protein
MTRTTHSHTLRRIGWMALLIVCFIFSTHGYSQAISPIESHTYFIDCSTSNAGDGSSAHPWNSLTEAQKHSFVPGDRVALARGTVCHGSFAPQGSGAEGHPIRLTAFGEGARPKIVAGGKVTEAFKLFNQQNWDIDSLDFSGGSTFGVFISGDKGVLHHIHLSNLIVHDVLGEDLKHKESGLVVISPSAVTQHFDDVLIDGVTAFNTKQWAGIHVGGGNFGYPPESEWSSHVIIRNSIVHDVQGDGIVLFRVRDGVIDSSVAWNIGLQLTQSIGTPNAIWTWMCHDCVVSNSEAFLTDSPGVDGGAFDIDYGNTNNSVIDSFGHDTEGYCVAVFGAGFVTRSSTVRGNVCIDNGRSPRLALYQGALFLLTWNNGSIDGLTVENNTVYWNPPALAPALINNAAIQGEPAIFRNNKIHSTSSLIGSNDKLILTANQYEYVGASPQRWQYGDQTFATFSDYQAKSHQDLDSAFRQIHRVTAGGSSSHQPSLLPNQRAAASAGNDPWDWPIESTSVSGQWQIRCVLPAKITVDGLLDADTRRQLVVLKSLRLQFPPERLKIVVELSGLSKEIKNALPDLQMHNVEFVVATKAVATGYPTISLNAPGGKAYKIWQGFAGPAQIGFAVRQALGSPEYSQMGSADE